MIKSKRCYEDDAENSKLNSGVVMNDDVENLMFHSDSAK